MGRGGANNGSTPVLKRRKLLAQLEFIIALVREGRLKEPFDWSALRSHEDDDVIDSGQSGQCLQDLYAAGRLTKVSDHPRRSFRLNVKPTDMLVDWLQDIATDVAMQQRMVEELAKRESDGMVTTAEIKEVVLVLAADQATTVSDKDLAVVIDHYTKEDIVFVVDASGFYSITDTARRRYVPDSIPAPPPATDDATDRPAATAAVEDPTVEVVVAAPPQPTEVPAPEAAVASEAPLPSDPSPAAPAAEEARYQAPAPPIASAAPEAATTIERTDVPAAPAPTTTAVDDEAVPAAPAPAHPAPDAAPEPAVPTKERSTMAKATPTPPDTDTPNPIVAFLTAMLAAMPTAIIRQLQALGAEKLLAALDMTLPASTEEPCSKGCGANATCPGKTCEVHYGALVLGLTDLALVAATLQGRGIELQKQWANGNAVRATLKRMETLPAPTTKKPAAAPPADDDDDANSGDDAAEHDVPAGVSPVTMSRMIELYKDTKEGDSFPTNANERAQKLGYDGSGPGSAFSQALSAFAEATKWVEKTDTRGYWTWTKKGRAEMERRIAKK